MRHGIQGVSQIEIQKGENFSRVPDRRIPKFEQVNKLFEVSSIDVFENHLNRSFNKRNHRLHRIIFSLKLTSLSVFLSSQIIQKYFHRSVKIQKYTFNNNRHRRLIARKQPQYCCRSAVLKNSKNRPELLKLKDEILHFD